jgi:outer membrane protein assembly factor BamB
MRRLPVLAAVAAGCMAGSAADWLTDGYDSKRTAWQRDEKILSAASIRNMKLLWKLKLDNEPRQMHSLFPPLIIGRLNTGSGPREVAIETGVSDNLYAIDVEKGEVIWNKHFESTFTPPANRGRGDILCPGGITATPVVAPSGTAGKYTIYAASWDGMLHQLNAADGEDVAAPSKWMPPNGKPYALNLFHNVLYTHTAQGCGGNPNMVYSYDLATRKVGSWGPAGGGMWGRTGPAISSSGTMYTGTGDGRR